MRTALSVGVLCATVALAAMTVWGAESPPVEAYGKLPFMTGARMSPDGTMVAAIVPTDGQMSVVVHHLDGKPPTVIPAGGYATDWIKWKTDHRLIAALHRTARARSLHVLDVETRLAAVDPDGFHNIDIGRGRAGRFALRGHHQLEDNVVDMLPDDPKHILLSLPDIGGMDVEKIDVDTGAGNIVENPKEEIGYWVADRAGRPRVGVRTYETMQITYARDATGGDVHKINAADANLGNPIWPISFSPDPNIFYAEAVGTSGFRGVVEYDVAKGRFGRTIASFPDRDVDIVTRDRQLVAYIVPGDHAGVEKAVYLDLIWEHDIESINHALPKTLNLIIDRTADGKRLLVFTRGPDEPGAYYVLDRNGPKTAMDILGERYPGIDPEQVLPAKPISYRSRDGMLIPGYVVLPKNAVSRPLPFVVLPHGGPTARDHGYFDYWAQFLASRGYGVLQPNVRGSTGYGSKFEQAGLQQWGLAMQDDITDGTKWLIDQKMADPARICIMGGGYGGYSALMGAVTQPDLYRCVVSFDGISDLPDYAYNRAFFGGRFVTLARFDNGKLSETSPINHADQIKAPVLLVHSRLDDAHPVEQTEAMESALKRAGKSVEALYFDDDDGRSLIRADDGTGGDYDQNDDLVAVEANRIAFLKATEVFLKKNIGP
jgi:dienelactone hydrolase